MVGNYMKTDMKVGSCVLTHAASLLRWDYLNWKRKPPLLQPGTDCTRHRSIVDTGNSQQLYLCFPFAPTLSHPWNQIQGFVSTGEGRFHPLDPRGGEGAVAMQGKLPGSALGGSFRRWRRWEGIAHALGPGSFLPCTAYREVHVGVRGGGGGSRRVWVAAGRSWKQEWRKASQ